jgi:hypothetical protein
MKRALFAALLLLGACSNQPWINISDQPRPLPGYPETYRPYNSGSVSGYGPVSTYPTATTVQTFSAPERHFQSGIGDFVRVESSSIEEHYSSTGQLCKTETVVEVFSNGRAEWKNTRNKPTFCTYGRVK